jgi:isopentenyl diphosphate isomerase/L-lactate dehydrogenase-like FMN-dependent dehydrogenase
MSPEDAKNAVKCGVAAIIVSNHGGRQLDGSPSTLECLTHIVEAVKNTGIEIILDSGIQNGAEILFALRYM